MACYSRDELLFLSDIHERLKGARMGDEARRLQVIKYVVIIIVIVGI